MKFGEKDIPEVEQLEEASEAEKELGEIAMAEIEK